MAVRARVLDGLEVCRHRQVVDFLLQLHGVTSIVAGGWVGILVSPAGTAFAVVVGVLAGFAYIAVFLFAGVAVPVYFVRHWLRRRGGAT